MEIMQDPAKQRKTEITGKSAEAPQKRRGDDLTCSESEMEDVFSAGESVAVVGKGRNQKRRPKTQT
jgi:hypothetical protein